jgi:hypothetical protein
MAKKTRRHDKNKRNPSEAFQRLPDRRAMESVIQQFAANLPGQSVQNTLLAKAQA